MPDQNNSGSPVPEDDALGATLEPAAGPRQFEVYLFFRIFNCFPHHTAVDYVDQHILGPMQQLVMLAGATHDLIVDILEGVAGELALPDSMTMDQASGTKAVVDAGLDPVLHGELLELVTAPSHGTNEFPVVVVVHLTTVDRALVKPPR